MENNIDYFLFQKYKFKRAKMRDEIYVTQTKTFHKY